MVKSLTIILGVNIVAKLQALLFDVDGTLADTEKDGHRVAFNSAFAAAGLDWNWSVEKYGDLLRVTGGKERIRLFLQDDHPDMLERPDLDEFIAGLHRSKTDFYTQLLGSGAIPLRPGVKRILDEARAKGYRLAIVTTTTPANVTALLENTLGTESEEWFEVIAAGDVVPAKKPAPDIFTYAMDKMGLTPADCAAFEDSDNGVRSVLGAGIKTLIVTVNDYTKNHDFSSAPLIISDFGEPGAPMQYIHNECDLEGEMVDLAMVEKLHQSL